MRLHHLAASFATAALLLTGCGDMEETTDPVGTMPGTSSAATSPEASPAAPMTTATGSSTASSTGSAANAAPTRVEVTETDFRIALPDRDYKAGNYVFVLQNEGPSPHDFAIEGPGVDKKSEVMQDGQTSELEVTLQPGTYEVWCTVGQHRERGMETELTVSA